MTTSESSAGATTEMRPLGSWRRAIAGWRVFGPAIVINAVVQGLSVLGDPVPSLSWGFWLLVAISLVSIVLTVWVVACAAGAARSDPDGGASSGARSRLSVLVLSSAVAVVAVGLAILHPLLPLLILLLAAFVLPAVAAGGSMLSGFTAVGAAPVRYLFAVIVFLVLVVSSWVVALVLGLFVTGAVAAGVTWLWFGLVLVIVLSLFSHVYRRSAPGAASR